MLAPGTTVGGYRIEAVLGVGAIAVVYEATQLSLNRTVALKLLAERSQDARDRFRREAESQARLDHPHIVTVFEAGEADAGLYIAMQLIRGTTLREAIDAGLEPAGAVEVLGPIADGLDVAHAAGLVHRDIKPRNILLDGRRAYLTDFGLVKALDRASLTDVGQFMGTPAYVAPEQVRCERPAPASDIYSLAAVFYECVTGAVVFPYTTMVAALNAVVNEAPAAASDRRPGLPVALDAPLARGLAKDPADRPASASALIAGIAAALRG
jgi:serine/threonine-protein kinase